LSAFFTIWIFIIFPSVFELTNWCRLRARFEQLFDDPRAAAVGEGLLVGLLDDLDFHGRSSWMWFPLMVVDAAG
jgi:hypothetical protein